MSAAPVVRSAAGANAVAIQDDKDGITDIAVWRPSSGSYFFLRTSTSSFGSTHWGANGDIPIQSSLNP